MADRKAWLVDLATKRILVTGGAGFLGRAVCRNLEGRGAQGLIIPRRKNWDLTDPGQVQELFRQTRPEVVIHLAAEVGGILANRENPGRYFFANMAMGLHLIEAARHHDVEKFVQIGTVCSYPKHTPVPFSEDSLWDGYPEETNAPYGVAKRALLVMLQAYREQYGLNGIYLLPVNLYGPHDNFDPQTSHVIPALIRKFTEANRDGRATVELWGTGQATREFLYVDDAAQGIVEATERYDSPEPVNLGTGEEVAIRYLAGLIAELTGYRGTIAWNSEYPDGQPRRRLDTGRAQESIGFIAATGLETGLERTIDWWSSVQSSSADAAGER